MKYKLIKITLFFVALLILFYATIHVMNENSVDSKGEQIVALNEIEQLTKLAVINNETTQLAVIEEKIEILQNNIRNSNHIQTYNSGMEINIVICFVCLLFVLIIFGYVYFAILHPFEKMKSFASKIAHL